MYFLCTLCNDDKAILFYSMACQSSVNVSDIAIPFWTEVLSLYLMIESKRSKPYMQDVQLLRTRQKSSLLVLICFCWAVYREKPCHYCGNPGQSDNASCFHRSVLGSPGNKRMRLDVKLRDCGQKLRSGYLRIISRTGQLLTIERSTVGYLTCLMTIAGCTVAGAQQSL